MEQLAATLDGIDWEALLVSLITSLFRIVLILIVAWGMIKAVLLPLRRVERALVERGEGTDRVVEIMKRVGAELKQDVHYGHNMLSDVEVFGVDDFGESALVVKGRIRTRPIMQWEVGREYRRRLKKAFDREGVELPYPQRTVHSGKASDPLAVQVLAGGDGIS